MVQTAELRTPVILIRKKAAHLQKKQPWGGRQPAVRSRRTCSRKAHNFGSERRPPRHGQGTCAD